MTDIDERTHARLLARGRRWWDLVSPLHGSAGGQTTRVAEWALEYLDLRPGDTVLDLGCGSGAALVVLSAAVGPAGHVVGIDNSPRMLARSERIVAEHGLGNVTLRRADATRTAIEPASYDAVYAGSSISAMPDVRAALTTVHDALRPGRPLVVFDMRLKPTGRAAALIRLLGGLYRVSAGWAGVDVLDTAREVFPEVIRPDPPGREGRGQPDGGWPPLTMFVAVAGGRAQG